MGDGTQKNPYTREDVRKLIEKNGGTAKGLNLSGKVFEEAIDLTGLDLWGIILNKTIFLVHFAGKKTSGARFNGSRLWQAHLEEADLQYAHLEEVELAEAHLQGAILLGAHLERAVLFGAHLEGAHLDNTHLEGASFSNAHLKGVHLWAAKFSSDTDLVNVDWGDYILAEERELREAKGEEREECLASWAIDNVYRRLKVWYTQAGYSGIAAKFYFREKEAERKYAKRQRDRVGWWLSWAFFGHGEGWKRILPWIAGVVLLFALIYLAIGTFIPTLGTLTPNTFLHSLYYSAVSFTALGYGQWAPQPTGWLKGLGAFEAFVGVFMMALLLVTFVRKWTR
jgi:hypothetical protein